LSFADEVEANDFFGKILFCMNTPVEVGGPPVTAAPPPAQARKTAASTSTPAATANPKKNEFFSNLKSKIYGEEKQLEVVLPGPRNFRHESHIGWNPEQEFDIRNIPPQWKHLFQAAGVKKSELGDAETAK
jgi:Wiskott-Aldrich syndrome protein